MTAQAIALENPNPDSSYRRIARALLYLAANFRNHPTLDQAAEAAGWSVWHFQREFTRMAGVSPKAFIAHLTLERAKSALAAGLPLLDASLEAGLSGPSRLHDLTLKIEAMTPGNYARRGAGLTIAYGWHESLFGHALLAVTEHGLCGLSFAGEDEELEFANMIARWPHANFVRDTNATRSYAEAIFRAPADGRSRIPIRLFGTPWQINVWKALLAIPEGSTVAYGALAKRVCSVRAARALGSAVGRNPIALLIPCHRVITATGALGGYRWGEARKRALLALESARREESGHQAA